MDCEICEKCVVGHVYNFTSGNCEKCLKDIPAKKGAYMGMHKNMHIFRVHPVFFCPNCGTRHRYAGFLCNGIDVTGEFQRIHENKPHWIGE